MAVNKRLVIIGVIVLCAVIGAIVGVIVATSSGSSSTSTSSGDSTSPDGSSTPDASGGGGTGPSARKRSGNSSTSGNSSIVSTVTSDPTKGTKKTFVLRLYVFHLGSDSCRSIMPYGGKVRQKRVVYSFWGVIEALTDSLNLFGGVIFRDLFRLRAGCR